MRRSLILLALAGLAACDDSTRPLAPAPEPSGRALLAAEDGSIPGHYIVSVNWSTDAGLLARQFGIQPKHVYTELLNGFAGAIPDDVVQALAADPRVLRVSVQRQVRALGTTTQTGATWGLDRINQRALPLDSTYSYRHTGRRVTAYIIDTGVHTRHVEFEGRASYGFDAHGADPANPTGAEDCHGHGTHVAGTVGGKTYGIAKQVKLVAVRVLGCAGYGSDADVIAGMDWVAKNATLPAVANMSLGDVIPTKTMGTSYIVDDVLKAMIASGVTVSVAAGNGWGNGTVGADACMFPFSNVAEALVVAASGSTDSGTRWTNFGECVDVFAPGLSITSAYAHDPRGEDQKLLDRAAGTPDPAPDTWTEVSSGTSMAAPHVAGVAALVLDQAPGATPAEVERIIVGGATQNIITQHAQNPGHTSNNHLLYSLVDAGPLTGKTGPTVPCTPRRKRAGEC